MPARKPTRLLELSGAFRRHPERRRANEPHDDRLLGHPPERLPAEVIPYWDEIAAMCAPGVLKRADRWAVELAARLMFKAAEKPSLGAVAEIVERLELDSQQAKALIASAEINSSELQMLRSLLGSLGLTPVDRSRLSVPADKPTNRFAALAAEAMKHRPN